MASINHSSGAIPKSKSAPIQQQIEYMTNLATKYREALQKDIESNEIEQNKLTVDIDKIHQVMEQLEKLSEQPEWPESFVQVNPLAYIPANIIHTGEHYVKLGPEIYTLMSLKETLAFLQRKIDRAQKILDIFKMQQKQLEERSRFSFDSVALEDVETIGMPLEIISNKGIAQKTTAGLYEIVETYDEEDEQAFYEQRLQDSHNRNKEKNNIVNESGDYFAKLDEFERQESLNCELIDDKLKQDDEMDIKDSDYDHKSISERVKMILRLSGLYNYLLQDQSIQQHCYEHKTSLEIGNEAATAMRNESVLNELIVEALINEPVCTINDYVSGDYNTEYTGNSIQDISSNNMATNAFLDSIENDIKKWSL